MIDSSTPEAFADSHGIGDEFREIEAARMHASTAVEKATGDDAHEHVWVICRHALRATF